MTKHGNLSRIIPTFIALIVLVASACSIPTDDRAHEIPPDVIGSLSQAPSSTTTSTSAPAGSRRETLYLVRTGDPAISGSGTLEPVLVDIPDTNNIDDLPRVVIERLISLSPADIGQSGSVNAIPKGTRVSHATVDDDGVLNLDLSGLSEIESALQRLAVAQVVFTVTGLTNSPVRGIRFSVDGNLAAVPVEEGTKAAGDVVTRNDYPKMRDQVQSLEPVTGAD